MDPSQEGSFRINGTFGEAIYVPQSGPPIVLADVQSCTATKELEVMDVLLSGNRTGSKDGSEQPGTGTMTYQLIDNLFENIVMAAMNRNLAARRAARNAGQRIPRTFTLELWQDDPEALGAMGWRLLGCRVSRLDVGFDRGQRLVTRDLPFRFEAVEQIRAFERVGNQLDPVTGLPLIRYTRDLAGVGG